MRESDVNWAPLDDIKPVRAGRGYSMFSAEEGERIRQFWLDNQIPAIWLARRFGVSERIIYGVVHRVHKFSRPVARITSKETYRKMWEENQAGSSLAEVAARYGCTYKALECRFNRYGWPIRPRVPFADRYKTQVREMARQGISERQIAKALGVSSTTVVNCKKAIRNDIEREIA